MHSTFIPSRIAGMDLPTRKWVIRGVRAGSPVLLVALFASACGQGRAQQVSATSSAAPSVPQVVRDKLAAAGHPTPSPLPAGGVRYDGFGIDSLPAPAGAVATVSISDAMKSVAVAGWGGNLSPGIPDAELRVVTDGDFGVTPIAGGVIDTHYKNRLAWVLTYHNSTGMPRGPRPSSPSASCEFIAIVDAGNADALDAIQRC
jgi:hypothetical protein